ncbi:p53-like transcription factor [Backusella circina FSU 941]|nr:p53-like transcription factor [Backusella circina FSU 941]
MQDNKWAAQPETSRNYMPLHSPYYNTEFTATQNANSQSNNNPTLPGMSSTQPSMSGLISTASQPSTPRPDMMSPPPNNNKLSTPPDLIRRRPPLPSKPASFTTTTFHSNPYPGSAPLRRRRTESSMFSFETGPSFNPTKQHLDLWNIDQSNSYQVQINAKMDRGFFRSEQDWTCYRRNYFQVSSTFDVHGLNYLVQGPEVPCLVRSTNDEIVQVDIFSIGVSARVSGSDKKIDLVQHTPKRDKGPQMIPEPRIVSAGGNLHLASVGSNHNIVTFERMQFKTATANNGKRRAAQQYYEIVLDLYANTSYGKQLKVATCVSSPLVVRGRSPGHYADSHTRYRSMDAGPPPSHFNGQGAPTGSTNPLPSSNEDRYLPQHGYGESISPSLNRPEFGSPYGSYPPQQQHQQGYHPYSMNYNHHPNRGQENGSNEDGYMMHPYSQPISSSHSQHQHVGSSPPVRNNAIAGGIREQQQPNSEMTSRFSSANYTSSEFGYMRSQNENSNHAPLDSSALDAGRSMTPDNKHY